MSYVGLAAHRPVVARDVIAVSISVRPRIAILYLS